MEGEKKEGDMERQRPFKTRKPGPKDPGFKKNSHGLFLK